MKSTVVPGTTEECVRPILESASGKTCGVDFGLGMNPEFLREGEAVSDFQHPDRIVLGAIDDRTFDTMARMYAAFTEAPIIRTNVRTAEMIKYASNALFATLISFSNEIGNFCAVEPGVDALDVMSAVHSDRRITTTTPDGSRVVPGLTSYLKAGCGFGGSCFPKDVRALIAWGADRHRPARLLRAVLETNEKQPAEVVDLLKKHFADLRELRVAVLGLASSQAPTISASLLLCASSLVCWPKAQRSLPMTRLPPRQRACSSTHRVSVTPRHSSRR